MREHDLKIWPVYFEAVVRGAKTYEFPRNDRDFQVGDKLILREWSPESKEYTGRSTVRTIGFISDTMHSAVWGEGMILSLVDAPAPVVAG